MPKSQLTVIERFMNFVSPEPNSGCWLWTGAYGSGRYGNFRFEGSVCLAHRVIYTMAIGPIPKGLSLDHLCCNTSCVNPCHLEPVTHAENVRRGKSGTGTGKKWQRTKTHCPRGHEYSGENLYVAFRKGQEHRMCRACAKIRQDVHGVTSNMALIIPQ